MRLWDFAAAVYARPAVRAACLSLQDDHAQCVSLLLWRAWTVEEGRPIDAQLLKDAMFAARFWDDGVTSPLREARRRLAAVSPMVERQARLALRGQVQVAELEAERLLLAGLEKLSPAPGKAAGGLFPALLALASDWTPGTPAQAVRVLAATLA